MKPYNVGDVVWWAHCGTEHVSHPCPVCFGKRQVTLVLGNDDQVILPCSYCSHGYEDPTGIETEYEYVVKPERKTITSIEIQVSSTDEKREYRSDSYLNIEDIFDTEGEALTRCLEVKQKLEEDQRTLAKYLKEKAEKSFAWNAGYHMRATKKLRQQIEYHEKMAVLCKAKTKD